MKILLAIIAIMLLAMWYTRWQHSHYQSFVAQAKIVNAKVTARKDRDTRHKNRRTEHMLGYNFVVDGKEYHGEERVEFNDLWNAVHEGDTISVYYSPLNPVKNHPVALVDRRMGMAEKLEKVWLK